MTALPQPIDPSQAIFYYASQTSVWIYFSLPRKIAEEHLGGKLDSLGFELTRFKGTPDRAYLALNPMFYTAAFNNGGAAINETEFNALVNPRSESARVPDITFKQFLQGWEQQHVVGQLRLDVFCDNAAAVTGGRTKYGEHKFLGNIDYEVPVPNDNPEEPEPFSVTFTARQLPKADRGQKRDDPQLLCFKFVARTTGLSPIPSAANPVVVYAAQPPEPSADTRQVALGSHRTFVGPMQAWIAGQNGAGSFEIDYGECADGPVLVVNSKEVPGSENFPKEMRERMKCLLGPANVEAYQLYASPPVEIEPWPFYVNPIGHEER